MSEWQDNYPEMRRDIIAILKSGETITGYTTCWYAGNETAELGVMTRSQAYPMSQIESWSYRPYPKE